MLKINTILNRYIFRELLSPFVICILFFTFVFLMRMILDITNFIVNYGISIWKVIQLLLYSIPYLLQFITPMAIMMSVLLTFLKMSGDNEVTAIKAGGVSIYSLIPPVFIFCLGGCLLTGLMTIYGLPWGKISFKRLTYEVAITHLDIGLKERTFNSNFNNVMLYVSKIDVKTRALKDVFIEDQRSKDAVRTVIAKSGRIYSDPENLIFHLSLENGHIHQTDMKDKSVHTVQFGTYDLMLDLKKTIPAYGFDSKDGMPYNNEMMTLSQLRKSIEIRRANNDPKVADDLLKFHEKFSLPFACIALGILAIPLGLQSKSDKQSRGVIVSFFLFIVYYIMLLMGWSFGESRFYPPVVGMWMPNIIMGSIGIYLLRRSVKDRALQFDFFVTLLHRLPFPFRKKNATK